MRKLVLIAIPLAVIACSKPNDSVNKAAERSSPATPAMSSTPAPAKAMTGAQAVLGATAGNKAAGTLSIAMESDGLRIRGDLSGLDHASEHGFHIHEVGDCSAPDASSAGGHFNPQAKPHGKPGTDQHHAGDMFNIIADAQGLAKVDSLVTGVVLGGGGDNDVLGKAIVLHKKADDYMTQPSGDSGDRIACGVIR